MSDLGQPLFVMMAVEAREYGEEGGCNVTKGKESRQALDGIR